MHDLEVVLAALYEQSFPSAYPCYPNNVVIICLKQRDGKSIYLSKCSHSSRAVVQNHIRLLQQYNGIKDIGQQLIGLVAENRGVSVRSLYQSREFGISRDD
jgi:hypothetical protein